MTPTECTLEDIKKLLDERITAERRYTELFVQAAVADGADEIIGQLQTFTHEVFEPAITRLVKRTRHVPKSPGHPVAA